MLLGGAWEILLGWAHREGGKRESYSTLLCAQTKGLGNVKGKERKFKGKETKGLGKERLKEIQNMRSRIYTYYSRNVPDPCVPFKSTIGWPF